jgi:transposase-like protein
MKASRFSDAQKAFIQKQGADGVPVADICRKAGISQATYFNWKKKYDGLLLAGGMVVRGARCLARRVLCLADTTAEPAIARQ